MKFELKTNSEIVFKIIIQLNILTYLRFCRSTNYSVLLTFPENCIYMCSGNTERQD